jgi:hypothetical protein
MTRTVAQDFTRWRALTEEGRLNVIYSIKDGDMHGLVCSKSEPWDECPWCVAIAVLQRAERKLSVRVARK